MQYEVTFLANHEPTATQIENFQYLSKLLDGWTDRIFQRVGELLAGHEFTDIPVVEQPVEHKLVA